MAETNTPPSLKPLLTVKDVAQECCVTPRTVFNWIDRGLRVQRFNARVIRIHRTHLEEFLTNSDSANGEKN